MKSGQVQMVFLYMLAGLIFSAVLLFGYTTMSKVSDIDKITSIESAAKSIQSAAERISPSSGAEEKRTITVDGGITHFYLIDLDKDILSFFKGPSVINNSIKSGAKRNAFFFRNHRLEKGMHIPDIEIGFPYFVCARIVDGQLDLSFLGTGSTAIVSNTHMLNDCAIRKIIEEIVIILYPGENVQKKTDEFIGNVQSAMKSIAEHREIQRDLIYNRTHVRVTLTATGEIPYLSHVEVIAKCLAQTVSEVDFHGTPPHHIIRDDPLIMWEFNGLHRGDTLLLHYSVDRLIDELCMREIQSLHSGMGGTASSSLASAFDDTPPEITILGPDEGAEFSGSTVQYTYSVNDEGSAIESCHLIRNAQQELSAYSISKDTPHSFIESPVSVGTHYWFITCKDSQGNAGSSPLRTFEVLGTDVTGPVVTLIYPEHNAIISETNIDIIYKVADSESGIAECSLYRNDEWIMTDSGHAITQGVPKSFRMSMAPGTYKVRIVCSDDSPNRNEGLSDLHKFTLEIT